MTSDKMPSADAPLPGSTGSTGATRSRLVTWGMVLFIAATAFAVDLYYVRVSTDKVDIDIKNLILFSVTAGALLLCAAWLLLRSRFSPMTKSLMAIAAALVVITMFATLKFKHFTGDMLPVLAFRWTPAEDALLPDLETKLTNSEESAAINLTDTSTNDFAQFMGPHGAAGLPDTQLDGDWKEHPPKVVWRKPIGGGLSGFAVVGNFAVTQEQRGEERLLVCYELLTGTPLWSHSRPGRFTSVLGRDGPRATPTISDGRVYCQWSGGELTCHDGSNGELLWVHDLLKEHKAKQLNWGHSGSPLVTDGKVIVSAGGPDGHSLVAYDKDSGELLWNAGDDNASYASPVRATLAGVDQVLTTNEDWLVGHRLSDGEVLWKYSWPGKSDSNANTSQPIPLPDDHVFISHGYNGGCALLRVAAAEDGSLSVKEELADKTLLKTKMSNVAVRGDFIYGLSGGILECVEWRTLARQWKRGRYGHGQLLMVGDKLLVTVEVSGEIALVAANPEKHQELGRFQALEGQTWNPFVVVGPYLLMRNETQAGCFELTLEQ